MKGIESQKLCMTKSSIQTLRLLQLSDQLIAASKIIKHSIDQRKLLTKVYQGRKIAKVD